MAEDPENDKRVQEVITPASVKRMPKQALLQDKAEIDDDAMADATKHVLFQEDENEPSSCRAYYWKFAKERAPDKRWKQQIANMEERAMQATTPKIAKKPKVAASSATELFQKMEAQLQKANEVLEKMVDTVNGDNPPPYIRDVQQQLINMQNSMKDMERMHEDSQYDLQDLEASAANTHTPNAFQTTAARCTPASSCQTLAK